MTIKNSELVPGKLYKLNKEQTYLYFQNMANKAVTINVSDNAMFIFLYKKELTKNEICYPTTFGFKYFYLTNSGIQYNWVYDRDFNLSWFMEVV